MDKESIYDAEINPLMAEVIAICERAGISCLCTFDLGTEDGLMCTTCMPDGDGKYPERIKRAEDAIYPLTSRSRR